MTWTLETLGLVAAGFLVGAIPFSYLAVRWRTGRDLRQIGSGNPGATNALRAAGPAAGVAGLVLDAAKGFVPVWVARGAGLTGAAVGSIAVASVIGHVLSPFLGFRGGKGVATGFGALTALNPAAGALALAVFVVVVVLTRVVSLGSILSVGCFPVLWSLPGRLGLPDSSLPSGRWAAAAVFAIVLLRHLPNLRRLLTGTEARLGERRA